MHLIRCIKMNERFIEYGLRVMKTPDHLRVISIAAGMEGVMKLQGGDPDFPTPEHIQKAAVRALKEGWTHYPPNHGLPELREALVEYHGKYGTDWEPSEVTVTGGSGMALFKAVTTTINPDDKVIVLEPYYLAYSGLLNYTRARKATVPLDEEEGYRLDSEALKRVLTPRTKMIILCNPNNPTGTVYTENELNAIADLAKDNDLLVVTDECYNEFVWEGRKHISIAALPDMRERTIVCMSFSKTFSMTGWRLGYIFAEKTLTGYLRKQPLGARISTFIQKAGLAAIKGPWEPIRSMVEEFDQRRRFLVHRLNEIEGFKCHMPEGSIFTFPNIKGVGLKSINFAESLLLEKKILVRPGVAFGEKGEYHLRIPLIKPIETLKKVGDSIEELTKKMQK
jgi:aspartate/methionine/tyrosine aminotransferase